MPFNWTDWQDTGSKYVESPEKIEDADVTTIQKLFATHVRKERFCDGHLSVMFENGHVPWLLRRLTASSSPRSPAIRGGPEPPTSIRFTTFGR